MPRGHPKGTAPWPCRHCVMVGDYRDERERQEVALEDELLADESARGRLILFKRWLQVYGWERDPALT